MDEILFILLILAGIWYWWDTQQCNEIALAVCQKKCANAGLQLLDATVTRQRSWLRRGTGGGLQICRLYSFEYSNDQASDFAEPGFGAREYGYIVLIGKQVVETNISHQNRDEGILKPDVH
jgi:hypothetical protein